MFVFCRLLGVRARPMIFELKRIVATPE